MGTGSNDKIVLVAVLKDRRDRNLLLKERWYRIPLAHLPKRHFQYIAFYQPLGLGTHGKKIEYYSRRVKAIKTKRVELLPNELDHPRAQDDYLKYEFEKIEKLKRPVRNVIPRRISFGFTSLHKLLTAGDILQLYGVTPAEQIIQKRLAKLGIQTKPQLSVVIKKCRFRIDLAVISLNNKIAVECDNAKAHAGKLVLTRDKIKDRYLRRAGWKVIRLSEKAILKDPDACALAIQKLALSFRRS